MPDFRPRFELVLTAMVAPRSAISASSSGRAQAQCASVSRGVSRPMLSRNFTMPSGRARSAQPRWYFVSSRCMCTGRPVSAEARAMASSSGVLHHCTAVGPYCTVTWSPWPSACTIAATSSTSASCCAGATGRTARRWATASRMPGRSAVSTAASSQ
jgi:hypothetical protein